MMDQLLVRHEKELPHPSKGKFFIRMKRGEKRRLRIKDSGALCLNKARGESDLFEEESGVI